MNLKLTLILVEIVGGASPRLTAGLQDDSGTATGMDYYDTKNGLL